MNGYAADLFGVTGVPNSRKAAVDLETVPYPTPWKRRFARPTHISRIPRGTDIATATFGARLLGKPLFPQGEESAALLNARRPDGSRLYSELVKLIPRRGTKTTSVFSELLGRCARYPGTQILTTAQDGTRAREYLRDEIMEALTDTGLWARLGLGRFRIANGSEAIEFGNGSAIRAMPPKPEKWRSKAADVVLIDEAGEIDAELGASLLGAILPLMDTRPGAQLIVAGTPPEEGLSLLEVELAEALNPKVKTTAALAYMLREGETAAIIHDDGTLELDARVIRRVHPGIGTVTTLPTIRARFDKLTSSGHLGKFEAEYGCKFPVGDSNSALDVTSWSACSAGAVLPPRPQRVGLAFDVEPDGTYAALLAAWRDDEGLAQLELLAFRAGYDWLAPIARNAGRKHRVPVAHDAIGINLDVAQTLARLRTATAPVTLRFMQAATARLSRLIETRAIQHYDQPDLTDSVRGAVWRNVGDTGRLFGRRNASTSACPIVAAAAALWQYDQIARRTPDQEAAA